ncbi:hypothetical protein DO71_6426 [Burkholderia pseudomallei]|nr:hypothetical protein DO71_6426 [Burkholderia pseudomallei]
MHRERGPFVAPQASPAKQIGPAPPDQSSP